MSFLCYIYSYLANKKKFVWINNITNALDNILIWVLQGSIVETILFNAYFGDFFEFIEKLSIHNFADDNSLSLFAESVKDLVKPLS